MSKKVELQPNELIIEENADGMVQLLEPDEDVEIEDSSEDTIPANTLVLPDESDDEDTDDDSEDSEDDSEDDDTPASTNENPITLFAKNLQKQGILDVLEDDTAIEDEEGLYNAISLQVSKTFETWQQEFINELDSKSKKLFNHLKNGGKVEDFVDVHSKINYTEYTEADIRANERLQKDIVRDYYKELGLSDDKITKKIERIVDLEEEAIDLKEELDKIKAKKEKELEDKTTAEQSKKEQEIANFNKSLETTTLSYEEFIPGKKLSTDIKKKVHGSIRNTWEKVNSDLSKYAPILAYLDYYKILDGDFTKVITDIKTSVVKDVDKTIKTTKRDKGDDGISAFYKAVSSSYNKKNKK
jgi:hypothetical protein